MLTTDYSLLTTVNGELAQLARAPALHAGGHRFDSGILHRAKRKENVMKTFLAQEPDGAFASSESSLTY